MGLDAAAPEGNGWHTDSIERRAGMSRSLKRWGVLGRGALAFPSPRSRGAGAFRAREHAGADECVGRTSMWGGRACRTGEHAARMSISIPLRRLLATEETNRVADVLERPLKEAGWG